MAKKKTTGTEDQQEYTEFNYENFPEGLRSIKLEVENFKKLQNTIINIGGRSFMIIGPNESGKSTLIQAMASPMNSKLLPTEPLRTGEEHARISHTIGGIVDGVSKTYIMDLYFTKNDRKGRLVIKNEKGEVLPKPATLIKSIIGNVSFDVTQWLNDPAEKKLKTIKALTGRGPEIDAVSAQIKIEKDFQKTAKERAEVLEGILNNHGLSNEDLDKYSEKIDIIPLQQAMSGISQAQQQWNDIKRKVDDFKQNITNCQYKINNASAEIFRLQEEIKRQQGIIDAATKEADLNNSNIKLGEEWLNATPFPSADDLNQKINDAIAHNEKFNSISQLQIHQRELLKCRETVENKKGVISSLESSRADIISKSQLPIQGLSFDDEMLYLDGLPLEAEQINKARLWDVGVDVAIALNPNLKVIFLHDGNAFDKKHLRSVIEKIEARGYMAVVEYVSFEGEELDVKFTEEVLK